MMEFFEAVRLRRSYRRFKTDPIPDAVMNAALDAALMAPNSSNLQPWEFYRVKSPDKKARLATACLSQPAATTAAELVVAVARLDTWRRNRQHLLKLMESDGALPPSVRDYYKKLVPILYYQDPFGLLSLVKYLLFNIAGLFRPMPRGPVTRSQLFEVLTKTTALGCENFMLAMAAQGYATCPMEGFDESRVKRLLGLNRHCHVVMVIGAGLGDPAGLFGKQYRGPRDQFIHEI